LVSSQAALALHNARLTASIAREAAQRERLDQELEIARSVQQRLFPQERPAIRETEYAAACVPAQSVGGDYYDYIQSARGGLIFAVGDVCGKGVAAALLMANLQASLRSLVASGMDDPAEILTLLNRLIYGASPRNRFITLWLGAWDPAKRALRFASAGHGDAWFTHNGDAPARAVARGVGLGLTRNAAYRASSLELSPGSLLAVATDGIAEARNPSGDEFGEEAFASSLVHASHEESPQATVERVISEVDAFGVSAPQHDDITLFVLRVSGSGHAD
jgi:sigma-B regulation protein RsbU (phosphoserine phosphatase)